MRGEREGGSRQGHRASLPDAPYSSSRGQRPRAQSAGGWPSAEEPLRCRGQCVCCGAVLGNFPAEPAQSLSRQELGGLGQGGEILRHLDERRVRLEPRPLPDFREDRPGRENRGGACGGGRRQEGGDG